jgi:hypothetical protein
MTTGTPVTVTDSPLHTTKTPFLPMQIAVVPISVTSRQYPFRFRIRKFSGLPDPGPLSMYGPDLYPSITKPKNDGKPGFLQFSDFFITCSLYRLMSKKTRKKTFLLSS